MKKIIVLLLALLVLFTLVSCAGDSTDSGKANNTDGKKNEDNVNDKQNDKENSDSSVITEEMVRNHQVTPSSDFEYKKVDGGIRVTKYTGKDDIVVIPEYIDDTQVVEVATYIFSNKSIVKGVFFPASIKELKYTFINNTKIEVVISEGVERILDHTFSDCTNLKTLIIGSNLKELGQFSFANCNELKDLYLPDSFVYVEELYYRIAIFNCTNLTIRCKSGSFAEQFCKDNNIPFKAE